VPLMIITFVYMRSFLRRYGPRSCYLDTCLFARSYTRSLVHAPITSHARGGREDGGCHYWRTGSQSSPFDGLSATMQAAVAQTRSCNDDQHPSIVGPASN